MSYTLDSSSFIKRYGFWLLIFFLYGLSSTVMAAAEETSILGIGDKLMSVTDILTRLMLVACFVVGIGFIFVAFIQYKTHRLNPKLVPLDKPVWYFVLGVLLIGIIFLERIFGGGTGNILHLKKQQATEAPQSYHYNIDAPIEQPKH